MRMRHKKNLDKRIENCDLVVMQKSSSIYRLPENERYDIIDLKKLFSNENEVEIEIGCGKGSFLVEKAKRNPEINYLGVEVIGNVIISAGELAKNSGLKNVKFLNVGAELLHYLLPKNSVSKIYLNFSCPYPKKQYASHRLTYEYYLNIYKLIMKKDALIIQKTDNDAFFEFSMQSFLDNGFEIINSTRDLYKNLPSDNIPTEYELKFVKIGKTINSLTAKLKENNQ